MNELVYLKNDEAVCDSLQVAEKFGKEHKNVLQSIDNLIAENSAVKIMFKISSYKSGNGQSWCTVRNHWYQNCKPESSF